MQIGKRKQALTDEQLMSLEKPARYTGNEINMIRKDYRQTEIRFCMCFPDVYEIGMSHLGIQILYDMFNRREDTYCERVYSPWMDLDQLMREHHIPLFALESQDPVKCFDFLGITLQYEMCYTNILQILDLSEIPMLTRDRTWDDPIVIGGGPCTYNPEPIADFFDLIYIGEGELVYGDLLDCYKTCRKEGKSRQDFLRDAAGIDGIYVPSLYEICYHRDGTIKQRKALCSSAPETVKKQVVSDLSNTFYPEKPLVPYIKAVQDRVVLEVQRGCARGCRFCQAGIIYRPVRERSLEFLKDMAVKMLESTGYEEISLSSLSSSDYSKLPELVDFLIQESREKRVNISLPSLRIDAFSLDVMSKVQDVRKSSLTFAPEAGSQRMRNVINKGLTETMILNGSKEAFESGWHRVKLYFMLGLPTEKDEDIEAIAGLSNEIAACYFEMPKEKRNGRPEIVTSTSFFIPKPFTPFQWAAMNTAEEFSKKRTYLLGKIKEQLNQRSVKYNCHDAETSEIEGVLARGDRKISEVIMEAYRLGCRYDAWTEYFRMDLWEQAFKNMNIPLDFYTTRVRGDDELFPWDFIDIGVSKKFLLKEYHRALNAEITPNCFEKCSACGMGSYELGICAVNRG